MLQIYRKKEHYGYSFIIIINPSLNAYGWA